MAAQLRILIVDDDPIHRLGLRRAIERSSVLGAEVEEAGDSGEGRAKVGARAFDCLLVDQDLPSMSGAAFVKELRAAGTTTPIVFVCELSDESILQAAVDAGVTDFAPKGDLSSSRLAFRIRFAIRCGEVDNAKTQSLSAATTAAHARDEVLAVVSHDLRGPLHAIGLASEALREEVSEPGKRYLGAIDRAIARAERLISDLLDASAVENGALALARSAVNINSVVRQAAADHELAAKESGGSLRATLPPEPVIVSADRDRVLQVLSNLIGNSLKHAKGTPIDLAVVRDGGQAVISVKDGGPGIAPTELPHVFDRYWSGKAPRRGGAGLGLAIAKGIVSAHGGAITVESGGPGAQFKFTLPLATA
jgi:signal transduction histidine kinase